MLLANVSRTGLLRSYVADTSVLQCKLVVHRLESTMIRPRTDAINSIGELSEVFRKTNQEVQSLPRARF